MAKELLFWPELFPLMAEGNAVVDVTVIVVDVSAVDFCVALVPSALSDDVSTPFALLPAGVVVAATVTVGVASSRRKT